MTTTDKTIEVAIEPRLSIEDTLDQMARRLCESTGRDYATMECEMSVQQGRRLAPAWRGYVDGLGSHLAPTAQDIMAYFASSDAIRQRKIQELEVELSKLKAL